MGYMIGHNQYDHGINNIEEHRSQCIGFSAKYVFVCGSSAHPLKVIKNACQVGCSTMANI